VNTVMRNSGVAIMGTASAEGEDRAKKAVDEALHSPLLEDNNIRGAKHILLNITSGAKEVTMDEIFEITEFVQEEAGFGTDLIWGNCYDENLGDQITVTVIATGFEHDHPNKSQSEPEDDRIIVSLDDDTPGNVPKQKNHLREIGFEEEDETKKSNTFDFDDIPSSIRKHHRKNYSYDEPYVNNEQQDESEEAREKRKAQEARRREQLRSKKVKLNNPKTIVELENEPAYLRRKVSLDDVPDSDEQAYSKWTISEEEEEPQLKKGNSYLHDNVD